MIFLLEKLTKGEAIESYELDQENLTASVKIRQTRENCCCPKCHEPQYGVKQWRRRDYTNEESFKNKILQRCGPWPRPCFNERYPPWRPAPPNKPGRCFFTTRTFRSNFPANIRGNFLKNWPGSLKAKIYKMNICKNN